MSAADSVSLLEAAVHGAVVIPLENRTHLQISGVDRASFLHNFCTNHIKGLSVGQGCEAFVTNVKGRILAHILVYAGPESLMIETVPGQASALMAHLDKYIITEDVQLFDRTSDWSQLYVSGANAALPGTTTPPEAGAGVRQVALAEGYYRTFAFGSSPGWSLVGPKHLIDRWYASLVAAGALPGTIDLFEQLRIEAGFPHYGVDISEDNLAQEANRTRQAISFNKGCYLGQEPIARLDSMGHVNRSLCQVVAPQSETIRVGSPIYASPDAAEPSGHLTSCTEWPLTGQCLGLGMLRRELARNDSPCYVGTNRIPGVVRIPHGA